MVFTIGICDDNPEQVQMLMKYLDNYHGEEKLKIVEANNPEDFLTKLQENKPQIVFLDIDLGATNGIQLGDEIRGIYEDCIIVYITAHEKYALDAFRVRAFHYLLKPLTKEKFHLVLDEVFNFFKKSQGTKPDKKISVQLKGEIIALNYNDIYYFEKIGHKIKIHTANRDIYFYSNFYSLLGDLDSESFVQCHQGYIANVDKIRGFRDRTLLMDGNIKMPVSRSFVENVKETLARSLFAGKEEV
jgi:DNA-binding LytR/AlgR family response regulator